jgi:ribulose-phosphate 3-epimerase
MDGHFVPNITFGPIVVKAARKVTKLPIDVHLMIENPDRYIPDFAEAGADWISVQVETCIHLNRTLAVIRDLGVHPGVVLNPATPLSEVAWVLEYVDYVLLMSVNPGFGGQAFIPNSIQKIKDLKKMIQGRGLDVLIQVDGGVNENTIEEVSSAGTDVFVAGSAIFGKADYTQAISSLKRHIVM